MSANGPGLGRSNPVSVVVLDEQELIRSALRHALSLAGIRILGEADSTDVGVRSVLDLRPDVVLMDCVFRRGGGVDAIERIALLAPASRILVLTAIKDSECLIEAILAGACGYVIKDAGAETIVKAVRSSAAGDCVISSEVAGALLARIRERDTRSTARSVGLADAIRAALTERELEIFKRLPSGETNHELGHALCLSENTIKNHVASILAKLHLNNRIQAAVHAVRSGLSCVAPFFALEGLYDVSNLPAEVVSVLLGA
jgi:DNA-binding NarL/FixJ family response regulator